VIFQLAGEVWRGQRKSTRRIYGNSNGIGLSLWLALRSGLGIQTGTTPVFAVRRILVLRAWDYVQQQQHERTVCAHNQEFTNRVLLARLPVHTRDTAGQEGSDILGSGISCRPLGKIKG
jgi:hypothetical protein